MIKIGIYGYGNLGRGVEEAVLKSSDMELVKVFSRRSNLKTIHGQDIENIANIEKYKGKIDVLVLCGGSATDLPAQTPNMARLFNVVDSFDTHARIPEHFSDLDKVAKANNTLGLISVGWDPGLFSLVRVLFSSVLPDGDSYTFWGKGVSQGHSDAIRRIEGVELAVQYTVPIEKALESVRSGSRPNLSTREKHKRVCYVVAKEGADLVKIEKEIVTMPNYFSDYDTTVNFISKDEFLKEHNKMPHGGMVIRSGEIHDGDNKYLLEFKIKLDSNPDFTGSVLTAFARAVYKMSKNGQKGAITAFDVPLGALSPDSADELRKHML